MKDNKPFDFETFSFANAEYNVSGFDYLHAIYKTQELPPDFILWFVRLFWPEFTVVNDTIFISCLFDDQRYREYLREGYNSSQAQFWLNLLEVTGLFDDLSIDQAIELADYLKDSWNSKLKKDFGTMSIVAKVINDKDTGEVFVTISTPS